MTWQNEPINVEQNSQYVESWLFFGPDPSGMGNPASEVPIDFTGATLKMQVRQQESSTSTLLATFATGTGEIVFINGTTDPGPPVPAYNNGFQLTVSAATSAAIAPGTYWYDVFMFVSAIPTCIMAGNFVVSATITR